MRTPQRLGLLLVTALSIGGCLAAPPTSSPGPSAAARSPLVTVETRGGECPQGACGRTIAIEADGRMHIIAPAPAELGTLSDVARDALATEIDKADFAEISAHPFTDPCPVAFDGQETVYTFSTGAGLERIASCEFVVDPGNPLFIAVSAAMANAAP